MRRQFGPAAQAGPETGAFRLGRMAEEAAVLALRGPHPADRPAIDAGRGDAGEEAAVEARVAGFQGQVAGVGLQAHVVSGHAAMIRSSRAVTSRFRTCPFRGHSLQCRLLFEQVVMQLSPSIFKAYDIRGIVPATLDEQVAEALGRAFGTVAHHKGEKTVAVGRDGRLSGPSRPTATV